MGLDSQNHQCLRFDNLGGIGQQWTSKFGRRVSGTLHDDGRLPAGPPAQHHLTSPGVFRCSGKRAADGSQSDDRYMMLCARALHRFRVPRTPEAR
jgi:hypothetical protein